MLRPMIVPVSSPYTGAPFPAGAGSEDQHEPPMVERSRPHRLPRSIRRMRVRRRKDSLRARKDCGITGSCIRMYRILNTRRVPIRPTCRALRYAHELARLRDQARASGAQHPRAAVEALRTAALRCRHRLQNKTAEAACLYPFALCQYMGASGPKRVFRDLPHPITAAYSLAAACIVVHRCSRKTCI